MFSSFGSKLVMKKLGIPTDVMKANPFGGEPEPPKKAGKKDGPAPVENPDEASAWPKWMTVRNLPLTVQPWLSPAPPPVPIAAECPKIGEPAPMDRDKKLVLGGGKKVVVVFLRCVGCAFAQNTFLTLRNLANKHQFNNVTCIAISHSSAAATQKWLDLMGGAWNVQVIIDEDRAIYAAWGIGLSSVWYYFNPMTQSAAWKEKGWLGARVATSIQRQGTANGDMPSSPSPGEDGVDIGPGTTLGNKWQQAGAFAIDDKGAVVWGGKAKSADDLMDLESGFKALGL